MVSALQRTECAPRMREYVQAVRALNVAGQSGSWIIKVSIIN